ncbi:MAG: hypothetical protein ACXVI8_07730 [Halobacteriota archaeon]
MATRLTARDYALYVGCLLASVATHVIVTRSFDLVGDVAPAFAINAKSSGIFIIATVAELTVEVSWFFAALFLPRIEKLPIRKRRVSNFPKNVQDSP